MTAAIADSLSPAELADIAQAFGLELEPIDYVDDSSFSEREIESQMGFVDGWHLWHSLWLFGIVVDDDAEAVRRTGGLWLPNGERAAGYYVPDDYDTTVKLIELAGPHREDQPC